VLVFITEEAFLRARGLGLEPQAASWERCDSEVTIPGTRGSKARYV
jgi:hypothetical protein